MAVPGVSARMKAVCLRTVLATCLLCCMAAAHAGDAVPTARDFLQVDRIVAHDGIANHVRVYCHGACAGAAVVILPSLGRGVEDYTEAYGSNLTTRLVQSGFRVVLIQPRGIGRSRGELAPEQASMQMFAHDIRACLDALGIRSAHVIGHAFGNRLARTLATLYPDSVDRLVLMAAGGNFAMSQAQKDSLRQSLDPALDEPTRLAAIQRGFFAQGNDARVWLNGWYPALAKAQVMASRSIDSAFFKRAGGKPFLLLQPVEDFIAPPALAGRALKAELGAQVDYVEIPHAGHALVPEQPDRVVERIIAYLKGGD